MKKLPTKYKKAYSERKLWRKIQKHGKSVGVRTIYPVLLLFYAFQRKETNARAKGIIIGTLGYFLTPLDFIPDLNPFLGFNDDLSVVGFALVLVACYIDESVRTKARGKLSTWFGEYDATIVEKIDNRL